MEIILLFPHLLHPLPEVYQFCTIWLANISQIHSSPSLAFGPYSSYSSSASTLASPQSIPPHCRQIPRCLPLVLSKASAPELFPWSLSQAFVLPACPALDMQISFQGLWFLRPLVFCFRVLQVLLPQNAFLFLHGQLLLFLWPLGDPLWLP